MTNPTDIRSSLERTALKKNRSVREITRSWRSLTGGGSPTLVACSGGADSVALALALWSVGATITLGHVVHDLRPQAEAHADRELVRSLAGRLGCPYAEKSINVAGIGNDEGTARTGRYQALAAMAREHDMKHVASAHHADDQLESMLMAIARGAGLEGLAGVSPTRSIGQDITLIRPMLGVSSTEAEGICKTVGIGWAHDATNNDTDRFRNAVRAGPASALTTLRPEAPAGAVRAGELLRDAAYLVQEQAERAFGNEQPWSRANLRRERAVVLGTGLRSAALRLTNGQGADQLSRRVIDPVVQAIKDNSTEPRHFHWPSGIQAVVTAHHVEFMRDTGDPNHA